MEHRLVFVVPVRHLRSVSDWSRVHDHLTHTLASISAQTVPDWECRVVANSGTDLPPMPPGCILRLVDLPLPVLPERRVDQEAYYDAIRHDKGLRIHEAVHDIPPGHHVMVVDFDDFISRRLAEFVSANREAPGWYLDQGYIFSGSGRLCYLSRHFNQICGTSHVVRRNLLGVFEGPDGVDIAAVKRRLGSHIFIQKDLARAGVPLAPLPFPGAFYRIGNPQSTIGTGNLIQMMTPPRALLRHPRSMLASLSGYRRVTPTLRKEFSLP